MINNNITLNHASPFRQRFWAWLCERFPLATIPSYLLLYALIRLSSELDTHQTLSSFLILDAINTIALISFFLLLRIIDEHKDFQQDNQHYPNRILQRGIIQLYELKRVAQWIILFQVSWHCFLIYHSYIMLDTRLDNSTIFRPFVALLFTYTWLILMSKEFFCGKSLGNYPLIYAFSHMVILLFVVWWVATMAVKNVQYGSTLVYLQIFAFSGGFAGEILRKFRAPEEVSSHIDAYHHQHTDSFLLNIVIFFFSIMTMSTIGLTHHLLTELTAVNIFYSISLCTLLFVILSIKIYKSTPCSIRRKFILASSVLGMLVQYTGLFILIGLKS